MCLCTGKVRPKGTIAAHIVGLDDHGVADVAEVVFALDLEVAPTLPLIMKSPMPLPLIMKSPTLPYTMSYNTIQYTII